MSQAALSCQWIKEQGRGINEDSRNHIYCWANKKKIIKNHRETLRSSHIVRCGASTRAWTHVGSVRVPHWRSWRSHELYSADSKVPVCLPCTRVCVCVSMLTRAHTGAYSPEVERPLVAHPGISLTRRNESRKALKAKTPPSFHFLTCVKHKAKREILIRIKCKYVWVFLMRKTWA